MWEEDLNADDSLYIKTIDLSTFKEEKGKMEIPLKKEGNTQEGMISFSYRL